MENITFDMLNVGDIAKIEKINTKNPALRRRIMDMGLTKGVILKVVKFAPLGDPVLINVRGYALSIRKEDLALLSGELVDKKIHDERELN